MRQLPENFFGWNDHKSIMLTKFATLAAAMGCVVMVLCGPRIVSWVLAVHALQLVHIWCIDHYFVTDLHCDKSDHQS